MQYCESCRLSMQPSESSVCRACQDESESILDRAARLDTDAEGYYAVDDMSDDADALASAGRGTDEDYGFYGEEE